MRFAKVCALLVVLCFAISSVASASSVSRTAPLGTKSGAKGGLVKPLDYWIYSNGPTYAETDAWNQSNYWVSDSFPLSKTYTLTYAWEATWMYPGDFETGTAWAIGTAPDTSNIASGFASTYDYYDFTNYYGYWVESDYFALPNVKLGAGTYWLTLSGAQSYYGTTVWWDQADAYGYGAGKSSAYEQYYGYLQPGCGILYPGNVGGNCSESFAVYGHPTTTPEPGSLMLLGSGLLGLGGVIRRRFVK